MTARQYLYVYRSCSAFQLALSSYANQVHKLPHPEVAGVCGYCSLIFEKFFCKTYVNVTQVWNCGFPLSRSPGMP
jgi:hypothetical protein